MQQNKRLAFHISFSLIHDESVAVGPSLAITDDAHPLDGPVHLKLPAQIGFSGFLGLWKRQPGNLAALEPLACSSAQC